MVGGMRRLACAARATAGAGAQQRASGWCSSQSMQRESCSGVTATMCATGMKAEIESLCPGSAGGQGRSLSDYVLEKILRGDYAD